MDIDIYNCRDDAIETTQVVDIIENFCSRKKKFKKFGNNLRAVNGSRVKDRSKETLQKREDEEREAKEKKTEDAQSEKKGKFLILGKNIGHFRVK